MQTRRANFRQEQLFLSCLPIMENNNDIKYATKRNVLTSGLIATYPFISSSIFDESGIFCGTNIYNDSFQNKNHIYISQPIQIRAFF